MIEMQSETKEPVKAGWCVHCRRECQDVTDDRGEVVWRCNGCGAFVLSDTKGRPYGTAANPELRDARKVLASRVWLLWHSADKHPAYADGAGERTRASRAIIHRTARYRVLRFLAAGLGLPKCEIQMLDLEQCRAAWQLLAGVEYDYVREWHKANPPPPISKSRPGARS